MQNVDGVTSAKVTLKEGRASVTLRPGNKVRLSELQRLIERNGFTPRGAAVVAEAEVSRSPAGEAQIKVSGSNETFTVAPSTTDQVKTELKKQTGRKIVVEGVIAAPQENPGGAMEVKDVRPAGK